MKRVGSILLALILLFSNTVPAYACDDNQSESRVSEILFGDDALQYKYDENAQMLLNAMYLCCEQADGQGQDKIDYLKGEKVSKIPTLSNINVKGGALIHCSHIKWEAEYSPNKKIRTNRKKILQNTVNKVFKFGTFNLIFGCGKGTSNSLSALIYYSHILSDYLADDPEDTEINLKGKTIAAYCGQAYIDINGGRPSFTSMQRKYIQSMATYSPLDSYGRCGVAYAVLGIDIMPSSGSRQYIGAIKPSGWNQEKYPGIVNTDPAYIYNRCHLIAHQLAGNDNSNNLITGTRYLNESGMKPFEDLVAEYIKTTGNHVLYRVTPVYEGDNKLASGVQIEAYSVEDFGKGISFNVYCYNVQPGIDIDYSTGKNEFVDEIFDSNIAIPFAITNPSDSNPDLIYEVNKHLAVLFGNEKGANAELYSTLMNEINSIAYEARSVGTIDEKSAQRYAKMKECEYKYYQTLKMYIPMMLKNEEYFTSAFE